jgi:hypothetical protein
MPAIPKYNAQYHNSWGWSLAIKGATDVDIAKAFGITKKTLISWKYTGVIDPDGHKVLTEFGKSLQSGKDAADSNVERAMYKRAIGYEYVEEETIIEADGKGGHKPIKIKKTTRNVPPDTMAGMYWLNNRSKNTGEWAQKQTVTLDPSKDLQAQMKGIADLINNPAADREIPE